MTRLLTVDDVAERLGATEDWVWAQARAGRIPQEVVEQDTQEVS